MISLELPGEKETAPASGLFGETTIGAVEALLTASYHDPGLAGGRAERTRPKVSRTPLLRRG